MVVNFKYLLGLGCVLLWVNMAQACEVTISHAWLRLPPPVSDTAAAYFTLSNHCKQSKTLASIDSPEAAMTMMHNAKMQEITSLTLKSGESFKFQPQSAHVMLMGLKVAVHRDDTILLHLHWQDGTFQKITMPVKDMRGHGMKM